MDYSEKINLFVSYAHADKKKTAFQALLTSFESSAFAKKIEVWTDGEIGLGEPWNDVIKQKLYEADIVLFVLSEDFLGSDYSLNTELKLAKAKSDKGDCCLIPLFFRYCDWESYGFKDEQGFPTDKKSQSEEIKVISDMDSSERDKSFLELKKKIYKIYDGIIEKRKKDPRRIATTKAAVAELAAKPITEVIRSEDVLQNSKLVESNDDIYAVLIANYKYSNLENKNIPNVQTNLKELENTFKTDLDFKNVYSIDNKDSSNIRKELEKALKKCSVGSTLLLYYAGHGLIESNSFYFASEDTELDSEDNNKLLKSSAVSAQNMKELLSGCKAKHKVLIFDCCYSSAFLNNSLSVDDNVYIKQSFEIKDTYYIFSSVGNKVSLYPDNDPDRPTYFTEALLKALKTGVESNYEFCSLEQIFELTRDELEKIKDPSGIPVPHAIIPDTGPLETIKICANPKYIRRSTEKSLSTNFESLTTENIRYWATNNRSDPNIENALKILIKRHGNEIRMIAIETDDNDRRINCYKKMIQFLNFALENKNDLATFTSAFQKYDKQNSELANLQSQENRTPVKNDYRSENMSLESDNQKAEPEHNKSVLRIENNQKDDERNQAQFKLN